MPGSIKTDNESLGATLVRPKLEAKGPRTLWGHNRNVVVGFIFTISNYAASSVWGNSILSAFIYIATDKDTMKVGISEGLMGVGTVLVGFISGWVSDKAGGRARVIFLGGCINLLAIGTTAVAVWVDWYRFPMLCASCWLWGVFSGVTTSAVEAIFGDSVVSGKRTEYYLWRDGMGTGARALGPLMAVAIFLALKQNDWKLHDLQIVMSAGLVLALVPCIACFCFSDSDVLGKESEALNARRGAKDEPLFRTVYDAKHGAATKPDTSNNRTQYVPMVQFISSLVMGIASGITSKYFPLYFIDKINLGPILVNSVYALMPITTSMASYMVIRLSYRTGRVQAVIMCMMVAIPLLFTMAAVPTSIWHRYPELIILVQVCRTSSMNAYSPISRSVLNDYAPKESRARWNSLSSFQKVGWSGSAVIGGWIIGAYGYTACFWITGGVQCIGLFIRFVLLNIIPADPIKESQKTTQAWEYTMSKDSFTGSTCGDGDTAEAGQRHSNMGGYGLQAPEMVDDSSSGYESRRHSNVSGFESMTGQDALEDDLWDSVGSHLSHASFFSTAGPADLEYNEAG